MQENIQKRYRFFKQLTVYIIFFIVLLFALIKSAQFVVPILIAILFSYLLYPIGSFLEKIGVPRIFANLAAIIIGIVALVAAISFISGQISQPTENTIQLRDQTSDNINKLAEGISALLGISTDRLALCKTVSIRPAGKLRRHIQISVCSDYKHGCQSTVNAGIRFLFTVLQK